MVTLSNHHDEFVPYIYYTSIGEASMEESAPTVHPSKIDFLVQHAKVPVGLNSCHWYHTWYTNTSTRFVLEFTVLLLSTCHCKH